MTYNRHLLLNYRRWNFSRGIHMVKDNPRMTATCENACNRLVLHLRHKSELSF